MSEEGASSKGEPAGATWTSPVKPQFENKLVFEAVIQKDGKDVELWHNPVTGAYECREVGSSNATSKGDSA